MFGKNQVVTPKAFEGQAPATLKVTSIFATLQGEGPFAGETAVFIRLTGCNLQCSFCDTYFDQGDDLLFSTIFNEIDKALENSAISAAPLWASQDGLLLVITGGEPMMQPNLASFLRRASGHTYRTQIESNGNFWQDIPPSTHLVISPKINERTKQYVKLHRMALEHAMCLKFVISANEEGYTDVPDWAIKWAIDKPYRRRRIYVSPMNTYLRKPMKLGPDGSLQQRSETDERISFWEEGLLDRTANQRNHEHAALVAMKHGAILTLQHHLYANLP